MSRLVCSFLALLSLASCQNFTGCGGSERTEGRPVPPAESERAENERGYLRRAAGMSLRVVWRANSFGRIPTAPPPKLPRLDEMPEGAHRLPTGDAAALEVVDLSLGSETVYLADKLVHQRPEDDAYATDEVGHFEEAVREKWREVTDQRTKLLERGGNAPEGGFGLQVFAPADLELRVLGRLLDALPEEPEVSVIVSPENLGGAGRTSESGASGGDSGGDRKLGEWLRSRPARGSAEATAACERDAVEIAAWYSFTRPWHRSGDRPFDVPRVSDANGEIDASEPTVRLTIGPERIRLHDTPIDEETPEGMSPDGKLSDLVEPMREQLTEKLEEKRQEFDLLGENPPEHLVLVVRSAAELPVEVSKELVDGLGDLAEFRLVVADESAPPLSPARTKMPWVDERLEEARAAETVGELVGSLAAE